MHFGVSGKATKDYILILHNKPNVSLISQVVEDVVSKALKIHLFPITPLSFDDPSAGNPCKYPHKPYIARNYSHCL